MKNQEKGRTHDQDKVPPTEIGARIKALRERETPPIPQATISIRAGLSPNTVQKIEAGTNRNPRAMTIAALEDAFNVPRGTIAGSVLPNKTAQSRYIGHVEKDMKDTPKKVGQAVQNMPEAPALDGLPETLVQFLTTPEADGLTEGELACLSQARAYHGQTIPVPVYARLLWALRNVRKKPA